MYLEVYPLLDRRKHGRVYRSPQLNHRYLEKENLTDLNLIKKFELAGGGTVDSFLKQKSPEENTLLGHA